MKKYKEGDLVRVTLDGIIIYSGYPDNEEEEMEIYIPLIRDSLFVNKYNKSSVEIKPRGRRIKMAYWDSEKGIIHDIPPKPYPGYPGWELIDCGCCAGIKWGGEYPRECERCGGNGYLARHKKTGIVAEYPGGKFVER